MTPSYCTNLKPDVVNRNRNGISQQMAKISSPTSMGTSVLLRRNGLLAKPPKKASRFRNIPHSVGSEEVGESEGHSLPAAAEWKTIPSASHINTLDVSPTKSKWKVADTSQTIALTYGAAPTAHMQSESTSKAGPAENHGVDWDQESSTTFHRGITFQPKEELESPSQPESGPNMWQSVAGTVTKQAQFTSRSLIPGCSDHQYVAVMAEIDRSVDVQPFADIPTRSRPAATQLSVNPSTYISSQHVGCSASLLTTHTASYSIIQPTTDDDQRHHSERCDTSGVHDELGTSIECASVSQDRQLVTCDMDSGSVGSVKNEKPDEPILCDKSGEFIGQIDAAAHEEYEQGQDQTKAGSDNTSSAHLEERQISAMCVELETSIEALSLRQDMQLATCDMEDRPVNNGKPDEHVLCEKSGEFVSPDLAPVCIRLDARDEYKQGRDQAEASSCKTGFAPDSIIQPSVSCSASAPSAGSSAAGESDSGGMSVAGLPTTTSLETSCAKWIYSSSVEVQNANNRTLVGESSRESRADTAAADFTPAGDTANIYLDGNDTDTTIAYSEDETDSESSADPSESISPQTYTVGIGNKVLGNQEEMLKMGVESMKLSVDIGSVLDVIRRTDEEMKSSPESCDGVEMKQEILQNGDVSECNEMVCDSICDEKSPHDTSSCLLSNQNNSVSTKVERHDYTEPSDKSTLKSDSHGIDSILSHRRNIFEIFGQVGDIESPSQEHVTNLGTSSDVREHAGLPNTSASSVISQMSEVSSDLCRTIEVKPIEAAPIVTDTVHELTQEHNKPLGVSDLSHPHSVVPQKKSDCHNSPLKTERQLSESTSYISSVTVETIQYQEQAHDTSNVVDLGVTSSCEETAHQASSHQSSPDANAPASLQLVGDLDPSTAADDQIEIIYIRKSDLGNMPLTSLLGEGDADTWVFEVCDVEEQVAADAGLGSSGVETTVRTTDIGRNTVSTQEIPRPADAGAGQQERADADGYNESDNATILPAVDDAISNADPGDNANSAAPQDLSDVSQIIAEPADVSGKDRHSDPKDQLTVDVIGNLPVKCAADVQAHPCEFRAESTQNDIVNISEQLDNTILSDTAFDLPADDELEPQLDSSNSPPCEASAPGCEPGDAGRTVGIQHEYRDHDSTVGDTPMATNDESQVSVGNGSVETRDDHDESGSLADPPAADEDEGVGADALSVEAHGVEQQISLDSQCNVDCDESMISGAGSVSTNSSIQYTATSAQDVNKGASSKMAIAATALCIKTEKDLHSAFVDIDRKPILPHVKTEKDMRSISGKEGTKHIETIYISDCDADVRSVSEERVDDSLAFEVYEIVDDHNESIDETAASPAARQVTSVRTTSSQVADETEGFTQYEDSRQVDRDHLPAPSYAEQSHLDSAVNTSTNDETVKVHHILPDECRVSADASDAPASLTIRDMYVNTMNKDCDTPSDSTGDQKHGISCVTTAFCPTSVGQNAVSTQEIPSHLGKDAFIDDCHTTVCGEIAPGRQQHSEDDDTAQGYRHENSVDDCSQLDSVNHQKRTDAEQWKQVDILSTSVRGLTSSRGDTEAWQTDGSDPPLRSMDNSERSEESVPTYFDTLAVDSTGLTGCGHSNTRISDVDEPETSMNVLDESGHPPLVIGDVFHVRSDSDILGSNDLHDLEVKTVSGIMDSSFSGEKSLVKLATESVDTSGIVTDFDQTLESIKIEPIDEYEATQDQTSDGTQLCGDSSHPLQSEIKIEPLDSVESGPVYYRFDTVKQELEDDTCAPFSPDQQACTMIKVEPPDVTDNAHSSSFHMADNQGKAQWYDMNRNAHVPAWHQADTTVKTECFDKDFNMFSNTSSSVYIKQEATNADCGLSYISDNGLVIKTEPGTVCGMQGTTFGVYQFPDSFAKAGRPIEMSVVRETSRKHYDTFSTSGSQLMRSLADTKGVGTWAVASKNSHPFNYTQHKIFEESGKGQAFQYDSPNWICSPFVFHNSNMKHFPVMDANDPNYSSGTDIWSDARAAARSGDGKGNTYSCFVCFASFANGKKLTNHMQRHGELSVFPCPACQLQFSEFTHLKDHMKTHVGVAPYVCIVCKKQFEISKCLWIHLLTHTGLKPYQCALCLSSYSRSDTLALHMKAHAAGKISNSPRKNRAPVAVTLKREHPSQIVIDCLLCKERFHDERSLHAHMQNEHGGRPKDVPVQKAGRIPCHVCKKHFTGLGTLIVHMKCHSEGTLHACNLCDLTFWNITDVIGHMKSHAGVRKEYQCIYCERSEMSVCSLVLHMKSHIETMNEKNCTRCGKTFHHAYRLAAHLESQRCVKSYPCKFCTRKFKLLPDLTTHIRGQHKKRNGIRNECVVCGKVFGHSELLRTHLSVHCEKVQCGICLMSFTSESNLSRHSSMKHGKSTVNEVSDHAPPIEKSEQSPNNSFGSGLKNRQCPICGRIFTRAYNVTRHFRKAHGRPHLAQESIPKENCLKRPLPQPVATMTVNRATRTCTICKISFNSVTNLKRHIAIKHRNLSIKSTPDIPATGFTTNSNLPHPSNQQLNKLSNEMMTRHCVACDVVFSSVANFRRHSAMKHGKKIKVENSTTESVEQEREPLPRDHGQDAKNSIPQLENARCHQCQKSFQSEHHLNVHKQCVHSNKRGHKCALCGKSYILAMHLSKHLIMSHSKGKRATHFAKKRRYLAAKCASQVDSDSSVTSRSAVDRGQLSPESATKPVAEICESHVLSPSSTTEVVEDAAKTRNSRISAVEASAADVAGDDATQELSKCTECNKQFRSERNLHIHVKTAHSSQKTHDCSLCSRSFTSFPQLSSHMTATHKSSRRSKPHVCRTCHKIFSSSERFNAHLKSHTNQLPYQCTICEKKFSLAVELWKHRNAEHKKFKDEQVKEENPASISSPHEENVMVNVGRTPECRYCRQTFASNSYLSRHMKVKHGSLLTSKMQCKMCGRRFKHPSHLRAHMIVHGTERYKCTECTRSFQAPMHLALHMRHKHPGVRITFRSQPQPVDRPGTAAGVQLNENHKYGQQMETPANPAFQCSVCQQHFSKLADLSRHLKSHPGVNAYKCTQCPKKFVRLGTFVIHMRAHKMENSFSEAYRTKLPHAPHSADRVAQSEVYSKKTGWDASNHDDEESSELRDDWKSFRCATCGQAFTRQWTLKQHQKKHLSVESSPVTESVAPGTASVSYSVASSKQHGNFTCSICGSVFTFKSNLHVHMRIHLNLTPYTCSKCGMKFRNYRTHRLHEKRHKIVQHNKRTSKNVPGHRERNNEPVKARKVIASLVPQKSRMGKSNMLCSSSGKKTFPCDVCHKVLSTSGNLSVHKRIHTGAKPYCCDVCGLRFRDFKVHRNHVERHCCTSSGKQAGVGEMLTCNVKTNQGTSTSSGTVQSESRRAATDENVLKCAKCGRVYKRPDHYHYHRQNCRGSSQPSACSVSMKAAVVNVNRSLIDERFYPVIKLHRIDCTDKWIVQSTTAKSGKSSEAQESPQLPAATKNPKTPSALQCDVCHRKFSDKERFDNHVKIHSRDEAYKCKICPSSFPHIWTLKVHLKMHQNHGVSAAAIQDTLTCALQQAPSQAANPQPPVKPATPAASREQVNSDAASTDAYSSVQSTDERAFKCAVCHEVFSQPWHLQSHIVSHPSEERRQCTTCLRSFSSSSHLLRHMVEHSEDNCYTCSVCGMVFKRSSNLAKHVRIEHDSVPSSIELNSKSHVTPARASRSSGGRRASEDSYPHEIPHGFYECNICDKWFVKRATFLHHIKQHEN